MSTAMVTHSPRKYVKKVSFPDVLKAKARVAGFFVCDKLFNQPHLLSPQFRHVKQPSMMMAALVLHFAHS